MRLSPLWVAGMILAPVPAIAALTSSLDDGSAGVSCQYWRAASKQPWLNVGGDWLDASGKAQGVTPYTKQIVSDADKVAPVQWDVTALVANWASPDVFRGILVQRVPTETQGKISFASRESAYPPRLILRYKDGSSETLLSTADAGVSCPWSTPIGTRTSYTVDGGQRAVLAFEAQRRSDVQTATLVLTTIAQYGQTSVGTYQLRSPDMTTTSTTGTGGGTTTGTGGGTTTDTVGGTTTGSGGGTSIGPAYELYDGSTGITCQYLNRFYRITWTRPGGDWSDKSDVLHGTTPFSKQTIPDTDRLQTVSWDVTQMVRTWADPRIIRGMMVRALTSEATGITSFSSREGASAPRLTVRYADGSSVNVAATADTHTGCPSTTSIGKMDHLNAGPSANVMLGFSTLARRNDVVQATLTMVATAQYGESSLGTFQVRSTQAPVGPIESGIAAAYPSDVGLEKHPDVIKVERFIDPNYWSAWANSGKPPLGDLVSTDPASHFAPLDGEALRVRLQDLSGVSLKYLFAEHGQTEPEQIYFRYYIRFSPNFRDTPDGGKLPGISGDITTGGTSGRPSDGTNGWSLRGSFVPARDPANPLYPRVLLGTYAYTADMLSVYGDHWYWPGQRGLGLAELDRWYSIEQYFKVNTPGKKDGVLRVWIDGRLAFEKFDVNVRTVSGWPIHEILASMHYGGTVPTPHELTFFIDNLVIAKRYIGPMAK